ncbi:cobB/CobQ-like glutamine amidotransferase domain protein, partial [Mycobacterium ulcerans str. Harvey]
MVRIGLVLPDVMGTYGDGGTPSCCANGYACGPSPPRSSRSPFPTRYPDSLDLYTLGARKSTRSDWPPRHLLQHPGSGSARPSGAPVLAICAAVQVLGHWYETSSGERVDGVGLLDATTSPQQTRTIGELI